METDHEQSSKCRALILFGACSGIFLYLIARNYLSRLIVSPPFIASIPAQNATLLLETLKSSLYRLQLVAFVLTCLCLALVFRRAGAKAPRTTRFDSVLSYVLNTPALVVSLVALAIGMAGIMQNHYVVSGSRYFILFDDAMISMRYARNWANGLGLVWNAGENVEGYSNFLWVVMMTLVHHLRLPENYAAIPIMAFNWMFNIGLLWLIQAILRRLGVQALWILLVLLCFVADINVIFWANSGLEAPMLAFLVTYCVWALISQRAALFLLALALIPLVRSDAFVIAIALGICLLWQQRLKRKSLLFLALATFPAVAHLLFRMVYYSDLLPNPYYLKSTGNELLGLYGLRYGFRFLMTYGLLSLLLPLTTLLIPKLRPVVLICCVQISYLVLIGGDAFQFLRFAVPILPLMYICAAACLYQLAQNRERTTRLMAAGYLVLAAPIQGDLFTFPNNGVPGWIELGVLIENNTPPNTLVALSGAGTAPYFAEQQHFIDLLGKTDRHIARVTPPPRLGVLGHNKFDFDYIYQVRQPEVLHTTTSCDWVQALIAAQSPEKWAAFFSNLPRDQDVHEYFQILNSEFIRLYLPNPVSINPAGQRGCLHLRSGSNLAQQWGFATPLPP